MQKYLLKSVWNAFFNIMNLFWDMKKISEKILSQKENEI